MALRHVLATGIVMVCAPANAAAAAAGTPSSAPPSAPAPSKPAPEKATEMRPLLDAYTALAEAHIGGVLRGLSLIAATEEAQRGTWDGVKGLLTDFSKSGIAAAAVWFARPDGTYYTVEKGATGESLADRPYFPRLMAGNAVVGDLVISKSTDKRSAIFAQPVKKNGKVIGALGVSVAVEDLSAAIEKEMQLPPQMIFYALDAKGQSSLHRVASRLFAYPSDMGSPTLAAAVKEMLSKNEGVLQYSFQGDKTVVFKKSAQTGWVYALACCQQ